MHCDRQSIETLPTAAFRERLRTAYDWLEANLDQGPSAIGEQFTLADCAAAPSLFYADWVEEIDERLSTADGYCTYRLEAHRYAAEGGWKQPKAP